MVIRSHGESRAVYEALQARGANILDATCPNVTRIHQIVARAEEEGRQPVIILAVTDKKVRDQLSKLNAGIMGADGMDPFYGAPVVLVVLADKSVPTYMYDGTLVMGNLMLAAHSLGIGSCWIHRAKEEFESEEGKKLLKDLGIDEEYEGIGHCILGYPAGDLPKTPERKENRVYHID